MTLSHLFPTGRIKRFSVSDEKKSHTTTSAPCVCSLVNVTLLHCSLNNSKISLYFFYAMRTNWLLGFFLGFFCLIHKKHEMYLYGHVDFRQRCGRIRKALMSYTLGMQNLLDGWRKALSKINLNNPTSLSMPHCSAADSRPHSSHAPFSKHWRERGEGRKRAREERSVS